MRLVQSAFAFQPIIALWTADLTIAMHRTETYQWALDSTEPDNSARTKPAPHRTQQNRNPHFGLSAAVTFLNVGFAEAVFLLQSLASK